MVQIEKIDKQREAGLLDIRNLQTFLLVADLESFTKAANELNYVQSTVTTQIQQLERELGFPLFDRIGKKVSLTSLGREFLAYADEIVHIMYQAGTLGRDPFDVSGTLRVGVLESLLFSTMVDILPRLQSQYKNVEVQLKMGQASDLLVLLKQNQLDMVYLSGDVNTEPDLWCRYRRRENLIFVAHPGHPAAQGEALSLAELLSHPFVLTERSGICYGRLRSLAAAHGLTIRAALTVDSTIAVGELVSRGCGLAFLPEYSVQERLERGALIKLRVSDLEEQSYYTQILCHKNKWIAPFIDGLIHMIREQKPEN